MRKGIREKLNRKTLLGIIFTSAILVTAGLALAEDHKQSVEASLYAGNDSGWIDFPKIPQKWYDWVPFMS